MLFKNFLLVGLGGMAGSILRYGLYLLLRQGSFPWSTFTVNIVGSFVIGLLLGYGTRFNGTQNIQLLLATGLCGGFTTFSAFSVDNLQLLKDGRIATFGIYSIATILLGLLATYGGYRLIAEQA